MQRAPIAVMLAASATLLMASTASAATKTVYAGPQTKLPKALANAESNTFYPAKLQVHVKDKVSFVWKGLHNISYGKSHPYIRKDFQPTAGVMDEAGAPFWFNGQPRKLINNLIAYPAGNGVADGKQFIASGLQPLQPNKKSWTVSFPKAGKFTFYCDIHKGMKMTVTVKKAGAKIPAAAADKKQASKELKADLAIAKKLLASPGPTTNVVMMGNDKGRVATFDFFPKVKNVHVGDTVSFEMTKGSSEEHTVTFGPPAYLGPIETILPDAATGNPPALAVDSRLYYASDPGSVLTHSATVHGNGFLNTGALDGDDGGPVPRVKQVTFTTPGSFQYLCLLHPQMVGTIVVS